MADEAVRVRLVELQQVCASVRGPVAVDDTRALAGSPRSISIGFATVSRSSFCSLVSNCVGIGRRRRKPDLTLAGQRTARTSSVAAPAVANRASQRVMAQQSTPSALTMPSRKTR